MKTNNSAVRDRLRKNGKDLADNAEQERLHAAAAPFIGSIKGTNPRRAETAGVLIKKSLRCSAR